MKKAHNARKLRDDTISELAAQIEAELSDGSREELRHLLAMLTTADDGFEAEDYYAEDFDDEEPDDFDEPAPYGWPSTPVRPAAGLRARKQRGQIGDTWWSQRFLDAVESTLVGGRLARGRSYARRGQVVRLEIAPGLISAAVQGSRPAPYRVRVAMPVVRDEAWESIFVSLASQASYCASMLAGELPHEVEGVFAEAGVSMLPSPTSRLSTDCTCPDWANPCKHVAAVCYLVAEQFDLDPFNVLAWRGRDRAAALRRLRELRGGATTEPADVEPPPAGPRPALSELLGSFWEGGPALASVQLRPVASETAGAVLRQLPRGLLEVRGKDVADLLGEAYKEMATAAQHRALRSGS